MAYIDKVTVGGTTYDVQDYRGDQLALTDGYYQNMTVGDAEQLVSTVGVEDKVPYNFRTSGGSADIGDREVDSLVGGTVAWNQLIANPTSVSLATVAFANGSQIISGHKYLFDYECGITDTTLSTIIFLYVKQNGESLVTGASIISLDSGKRTCIWNATCNAIADGNANSDNGVWIYNSRIANTTPKSFNVYDLTQMFGSTIADYIYTLETSTPGAGVAWFKSLFPKPYYAYNAGTLMSVCTNAHRMTGFNQWDEEWEVGGIDATTGANTNNNTIFRTKNFIRIIPGAQYYMYGEATDVIGLRFYDASKNYIGSSAANTKQLISSYFPSNIGYLRFIDASRNTYNNPICINLHWDGERDGEYEAYELHNYPLDDVELRGIPKLDVDNKLYYDGDVYESDGTVTRKYFKFTFTGVADDIVAGVSVNSNETHKALNFYVKSAYAHTTGLNNSVQLNAISNKFPNNKFDNVQYASVDNVFAVQANWNVGFALIISGCDTLEEYQTYLANNPLTIVYELATPTTESADSYQSPQVVNDWGTEEYVDALATAATSPRDVAVPVGHETKYQSNLRAKLEMAPDSPSGSGDYIVRQTNGQNSYVQLTFPADELPAAPTTDGSYQLKCTVSSGTATYTWDAIT